MAGIGPAPKSPALQRRPGRNLADRISHALPSEGRRGAAPPWPLGKSSAAEIAMWRKLWRTPQAVMWERLAYLDLVGRYARLFCSKWTAPVLMEIRQCEDRLGLSPLSMLRLHWTIDDEPEEVQPGKVVDIRERLKAVE